MEEKFHNSQHLDKSKLYNSSTLSRVKNYSRINDSEGEERNFTQKNIRNKLDDAFSDLDSLRNALKTIKHKNENPNIENTKRLFNKNN